MILKIWLALDLADAGYRVVRGRGDSGSCPVT